MKGNIIEELLIMGTAIADSMAEGLRQADVITSEMADGIRKLAAASSCQYAKSLESELRKQTNNWRKMHGLPMRRRRAGRKRGVRKCRNSRKDN